MREIMSLADRANQYINDCQPWVIARESGQDDQLQGICTQGLNLFRILMIWLAPVVPGLARRTQEFLCCNIADAGNLNDLAEPLTGHKIGPFHHLLNRIEMKDAQQMMEKPLSLEQPSSSDSHGRHLAADPITEEITIDEFSKVDLRVARVQDAQRVEGADRLLQLTLDLGGEVRQVFAGIKAAYEPETLVGRHVVVVANLAPRKMRFGVSSGMILAGSGSDDAGGIFLLAPDDGAEPGMRVR
jgi:methionyl-tRNA synthetase